MKFRLYQKMAKEMIDWDKVKGIYKLSVLDDNEDNDIFSGWMQYTGFKDQNGTEIFEKDIVHIVGVIPGFEMDDIGIVKFIDGSWMVENVEGNDGWLLFQDGAEVEVLGNVFENPELLQGGKGE
ncbi:YopX family protein [Bacillus cereus group sp. BfR-BA-01380]|uniref:YopX family protein n=1 Tax=Bacillus cereus group sp. BfR-BA-01380 TaxID=2920324 RepID=UPI001F5A5399|nr:YopX family protein [Bacillus cereus group sp. BfR-BA-01380]